MLQHCPKSWLIQYCAFIRGTLELMLWFDALADDTFHKQALTMHVIHSHSCTLLLASGISAAYSRAGLHCMTLPDWC